VRWMLVGALLLGGCLSREDLNRAMDDQARFSGRVMGFALDAHQQTLESQLALLHAFQGDPRLGELERRLGSIADVEAKLERVREQRRSLIEESQRLRARYGVEPGAGAGDE
jgi:hypothetical protein